MRGYLEEFKDALAVALSNAPAMRKRIIKKKIIKNKVSITELELFISQYAPEEYKGLRK